MTDEQSHFWDIIGDIQVCMVTTEDKGTLRSRPMVPFVDAENHIIRFVTDNGSAKLYELNADADIALGFVDTGKMIFASVSGKGVISRDPKLIRELWGPYCEVFFGSGPEGADVAIVTVDPTQAEYWDNNTSTFKMAFEMARAYFSEDGPNLGENAKLDQP